MQTPIARKRYSNELVVQQANRYLYSLEHPTLIRQYQQEINMKKTGIQNISSVTIKTRFYIRA